MPTGHVGKVPGSSRQAGTAFPLDVSIVDGAGAQVTTFGGTASTFGTAFPATGTAAGFKDSTGTNMEPGNLDASGNLKVNIAAGSTGNAAAGATGAAVPASADYQGINVGGTLRGQTGVNPTGTVFAAQTDLASIAGTPVATLDFDTGAGSQAMPILGIALPASGGAVAGGTSTNPLRTDPTGTTAQPVTDGGGSLTVDGAVTANAGTNLNTSALALEAGGNLAAAAASLSALDDWDESDRAKVNLVVGQAGVTAGAGAVAANTPRLTLASDDPAVVSLQLIDDAIVADDAVFTPATTKVMMAGFEADETSTDSVNEGDGGAARMTLDRKQIVTIQPHTAGGWLTANFTNGDTFTPLTNAAQAIKASAGQLGGWYIYNPNAVVSYVNIYNVASGSVTVGTTTPKMNLAIPAGAAANVELVNGIEFDTAMSLSATTTGGGNTAPTTALDVMIWYK